MGLPEIIGWVQRSQRTRFLGGKYSLMAIFVYLIRGNA